MSLQCSEDQSLRRSPRLSSYQSTSKSNCPSPKLPWIPHAKSRFSQSDNVMPLSREDSKFQTKLFRIVEEKSYNLQWNKDNKKMDMHLMMHDLTCTDPFLQRSPRFTLAPDNNFGKKTVSNCNMRESPRHSPLGGDTNIDLNCAVVDGSNKRPSKKVKRSQNFSTAISDYEIFLNQSSGENQSLVNAGRDDDSTTLMLKTTEKQIPLEINDSDYLGSELSGGKINFFIGYPICEEEARERWQWRYEMKVIDAHKSSVFCCLHT